MTHCFWDPLAVGDKPETSLVHVPAALFDPAPWNDCWSSCCSCEPGSGSAALRDPRCLLWTKSSSWEYRFPLTAVVVHSDAEASPFRQNGYGLYCRVA